MLVGRVAGGPATAAGPKRRARRILPRLSRVCRWGPAAPNRTLRSRCAHSGSGLFWLDPRAWVRGPARKVRWGCSGLGAGQRVGGGWSPVTVAAQVDAPAAGVGPRDLLPARGDRR